MKTVPDQTDPHSMDSVVLYISYRTVNTVKLHCIQAKESKLDAKPMLKT